MSGVTTAPTPRGPRGPYAKTAARRVQILDVALDVFGRLGYRGGSVREIAERVGLTDTGVLHHFGSKERLLVAVLEHREELSRRTRPAREGVDLLDGLRELVRRNSTAPGLIQMYVTLSAEATDPEHPAHDFFVARYEDVTRYFVDQLTTARDAGDIGGDADLTCAAEQLIAVMDGLQVQWLLNEKVDMIAAFDQFLDGFRKTLGVRTTRARRGVTARTTGQTTTSPSTARPARRRRTPGEQR